MVWELLVEESLVMKKIHALRLVAYAMLITIFLIIVSGVFVQTTREMQLVVSAFAFGLLTAAGWDLLSRRYERVEPRGGVDTRPVVWNISESKVKTEDEKEEKETLPTR